MSSEYVPPASFEEFLYRYPEWCRSEALKLLGHRANRDAVDDLTQEFHAHLLEHGIAERFDASRYDAAITEGIYRLYIRTCLTRHYYDLGDKHRRHKRNGDVISIDSQASGCDESTLGDSLTDHCESVQQSENHLILAETRHILTNHPRLLRTFELLCSGLSTSEIAKHLGCTTRCVQKRLQRIRELVS